MRGGELWLAREAWPEPLDDAYRALLARDDALVVVGTIDDAILGYGAVARRDRCAPARAWAWSPTCSWRRRRGRSGSAKRWWTTSSRTAATHECIGIDATALPGHRATKNFFETHGFTARALAMHRRLDVRPE